MATPSLNLTPSPHRLVFRAIVAALQTDPTLSRVIKTWSVFDGSLQDKMADWGINQLPAARLYPTEGPDAPYGPSAIIGPLVVQLELTTLGCDFDDILDLYAAFRRAIYPVDQVRSNTIHQGLVAAGAEAMYVVEFTQGAFSPKVMVDGPIIDAVGQIQIRVRQEILP